MLYEEGLPFICILPLNLQKKSIFGTLKRYIFPGTGWLEAPVSKHTSIVL